MTSVQKSSVRVRAACVDERKKKSKITKRQDADWSIDLTDV